MYGSPFAWFVLVIIAAGLTSGQDGDVDRHAVPPCTTKRRVTTT